MLSQGPRQNSHSGGGWGGGRVPGETLDYRLGSRDTGRVSRLTVAVCNFLFRYRHYLNLTLRLGLRSHVLLYYSFYLLVLGVGEADSSILVSPAAMLPLSRPKTPSRSRRRRLNTAPVAGFPGPHPGPHPPLPGADPLHSLPPETYLVPSSSPSPW
jgi:hypothetical protein